MSPMILVVEDEPDLVATLTYNLRQAGFGTRTAGNGHDALAQARTEPLPDLVLLDLMLPDISGTTVCRELKGDATTRQIPIIMLTAKGDEVDRVVGFELGAEDYVVKPFSVRELILRVQAILRRSQPTPSESTDVVRFGRLRVDPDAHRAWVDGNPTQLTALEFRLLLTLLHRRGRVQTRDVLLEDVWGMVADVTTRTVDTHVKRLRQKLGTAGGYIETLRGVGYRWRDAPDDDTATKTGDA